MLVSDPVAEQGFASVDVNAGSWSEPNVVPGLAHFLEHMLFIGSETYQETDYFFEFLSKNGGDANAYTADSHTNYFY